MSDIQELLSSIVRPQLLVRAARHGLCDYNRDRHLRRILRADSTPSPVVAARQLLDLEGNHEEKRRDADASYSVQRHIEALCALMGEARLLCAARTRGKAADSCHQLNASAMPAFLRAVKSSSASRTPGSSSGASKLSSLDCARVAANTLVSRAPSLSQVSNGR